MSLEEPTKAELFRVAMDNVRGFGSVSDEVARDTGITPVADVQDVIQGALEAGRTQKTVNVGTQAAKGNVVIEELPLGFDPNDPARVAARQADQQFYNHQFGFVNTPKKGEPQRSTYEAGMAKVHEQRAAVSEKSR